MRSVTSLVSLNIFTSLSLTDAQTRSAAVALSMFVYDYMLTFEDEVRYIWRRPVTSVKVLYIVLRYGVAIAELVYFQGESSRKCHPNQTNIYVARVALSGLATYMSHNVRIQLMRFLQVGR